MVDFSLNRVALFALFCLVSFSGCKDPEREKAQAEAEAAKTALAKVRTELETVKAALAAAQKERDGFKIKVGDLSTSLLAGAASAAGGSILSLSADKAATESAKKTGLPKSHAIVSLIYELISLIFQKKGAKK